MACIAIFPNGVPCRTTASIGSRWCPLHEEQQAKTLKAYKRYSGALDAFADPLPSDGSAIAACGCLETLAAWQTAARTKWALADRVASARICHHTRFCQGGDAGHRLYIETLRILQAELETTVTALDECGYRLILQRQQAAWVLTEREVTADACCATTSAPPSSTRHQDLEGDGECPSEPSSPTSPSCLSSPPSSPATSFDGESHATTSQSDVDSDDDADHHAGDSTALAASRLRASLVSRCAGSPAAAALLRFVVARTPALLVRAHLAAGDAGCDAPATWLERVDLPLGDLVRLDKAYSFGAGGMLSPHVLRNAITSLGRDAARGDAVEVLGGAWHRRAARRPMTIHEWAVFHDYVHCSGCALKCTRAFDEYLGWRAEARPEGRLPRYADALARLPATVALCRAGYAIVRCGDDAARTLERVKPKCRKMATVYVEHDRRCWVLVRAVRHDIAARRRQASPLNRPIQSRTVAGHDAIHRVWQALRCDARFDVLLGSDACARPWTTRLRSGSTPAARRAAAWTPDRHFTAASVASLVGGRFAADTLDAVVLSAGGREAERATDFADEVATAIAGCACESARAR